MTSEARYEEKCKAHALKFSVKYRKKSPFQDIIVGYNACYGKMLILDGEIQFAEKDEYVFHEMFTYPIFALNPKAKHILILGGGDGLVAKRVLEFKASPTIVELDEEVIRTCKRFFSSSRKALSQSEIVIGDALKFSPKRKYDGVVVDLVDAYANPSLYSVKALKRIASYAKKNAPIMFHSDSTVYEMMHKKLSKVFPNLIELTAYVPSFLSQWVFYITNISSKEKAFKRLLSTKIKGKYFSSEVLQPFKYVPTMKIREYRVNLKV